MTRCSEIRRHLALVAALLAVVVSSAALAKAPTQRTMRLRDVRKALWSEGRKAAFRPTTVAERHAVGAVLPELLKPSLSPAAHPTSWTEVLREAGLRLEAWEVRGGEYWVVREAAGDVRGAGTYVVRRGAHEVGRPLVVLQAPHPYHDLHTGRIAVGLFFGNGTRAGRADALFTASVPRYRGSKPASRVEIGEAPADVCHDLAHLFNVATDAVAGALPPAIVVQVHGFSEERFAGASPPVSAVVSGADPYESTELVRTVSDCLRVPLGAGVRTYPDDALAMGGTTNAQAKVLAGRSGVSFVHVELSYSVRRRLRRHPAALDAFGRALFECPFAGAEGGHE